MIPAEISSKFLRNITFDENSNDQMLYEHLTHIDKVSEQAAQRDAHYTKQVATYHNAKVKPSTIREGDLVLRKHEVSIVNLNRKLDPIWKVLIGLSNAMVTGATNYKILKEKF